MTDTYSAHIPVSLSVTHDGGASFAAILTCEGVGSASISAVEEPVIFDIRPLLSVALVQRLRA